MTILSVIERDHVLVVDSRLIAQRLGIEHESFMRNLKKYQARIESKFGVIRFEIGKPAASSKGGRPQDYALLTESQANALMTLSKNTDQVVECKLELVEAFEKAKQVIKEVIPAHPAQSAATPSPSLLSVKERLEAIEMGIHLFERLGGCDPRTEGVA